MPQDMSSFVPFCTCIVLPLLLQGCGGGGGGGDAKTTTGTTTTITTTTTNTPGYTCQTDLYLDPGNVTHTDIKGFALDDQTMSGCPDKMLMMWPHTYTSVKSLRLFASWKSTWGDDTKRHQTWAKFLKVVNANGIKILFGVDSAYDWGENEKQFQWALQMMKMVKDKDQILAISFGNEMDFKPGIDANNFVSWVKGKVKQMDDSGLAGVKVTMVWSMRTAVHLDSKDLPLLNGMYNEFKNRWAAWSFNAYSIFNGVPSQQNCKEFTANAISLKYLKSLSTTFRKAVDRYTKKRDEPVWIGETGWSSPCIQKQQGVVAYCKDWCSADTLRGYYQMFLQWDGTLDEGLKGVDHMFYFSNRDFQDFNKNGEAFGMVNNCSNPKCKSQKSIAETYESTLASVVI